VDLLLAAGVPVDDPLGDSKETALFMSVEAGYLDIATALLKAGANVNLRDHNGYTPFIHLAKYCDEVECVRAFIKAGADVNASTPFGWTALQEAERAHCLNISKELRKAGAKK
jgi:ankyrin repeat protein